MALQTHHEIDVGPLSAALDVGIGKAVHDEFEQRCLHPRVRDVMFALTYTATAPAAQYVVAGRPQSGRLWDVRKILVTTPQGGEFAATTADAYFCVYVSTSPTPGTGDLRFGPLSVPSTTTVGKHQLQVRGVPSLVVGIGGSGAVTVQGLITVVEIDDNTEVLLGL